MTRNSLRWLVFSLALSACGDAQTPDVTVTPPPDVQGGGTLEDTRTSEPDAPADEVGPDAGAESDTEQDSGTADAETDIDDVSDGDTDDAETDTDDVSDADASDVEAGADSEFDVEIADVEAGADAEIDAEPGDIEAGADAETDAELSDVEAGADAATDAAADADPRPDTESDVVPPLPDVVPPRDPNRPPAGWVSEPPPWITGETNWITGETNWITGETNWIRFPRHNGQAIGRPLLRGTLGAGDADRAWLEATVEGRVAWYRAVCDPCEDAGQTWTADLDLVEAEVADGAAVRLMLHAEQAGVRQTRDLDFVWFADDSVCDAACAVNRCAAPEGCDCGGCTFGTRRECGGGVTLVCGDGCTYGTCGNLGDANIPQSDSVPIDREGFAASCEAPDALVRAFDGLGPYLAMPPVAGTSTCEATWDLTAPISARYRVVMPMQQACGLVDVAFAAVLDAAGLLGVFAVEQYAPEPTFAFWAVTTDVDLRAGDPLQVRMANGYDVMEIPEVLPSCGTFGVSSRPVIRVGETLIERQFP